MSERPRESDSSVGLSSEARSLLRAGSRPRVMSVAERKLAAQTVAKIAATPAVVVGGGLTLAKVLAGVAVASAATVVSYGAFTRNPEAGSSPPPPARAVATHVGAPASVAPSVVPRVVPSVAPSVVPGVVPGVVPSVAPSVVPSVAPSVVPSVAVSHARPARSPGSARRLENTGALALAESPAAVEPTVPRAREEQGEGAGTEGVGRGGGASWTGGPARESDEQRESAMLGQAFATVSSDPARVLVTLEAYDREFARGRMRDERDFLEVLALRGLGREAQARVRAEALLSRSPRGMYAPRIRRMLERTP
jgi:hypothetical protein